MHAPPSTRSFPTDGPLDDVAPGETSQAAALEAGGHGFTWLLVGIPAAVTRLVLVAACLISGFQRTFAAETTVPKEYQLKAAFLYNFAKFIEWPKSSFADGSSPIVIGILGNNPFGAELENVIEGRKINGREIIVKSVESVAGAGKLHMLFVNAADSARLNELKGPLTGASVLTVGESETFAKQGGAITFTLEGDKLRFEVNMDTAAEAHLKISAQLQKLAKAIRRKT